MNKLALFFAGIVSAAAVSCGDGPERERGSVYMPDMAYSRAYETYANHDNLRDSNIFYSSMPVPGTVSRTQAYVYHLESDKGADTSHYVASKSIQNPVTSLTEAETAETERLYLINCAICHGSKLDGNGPLWKDGAGPFPAKPATLVGDANYENMSPGTMFYSITYGRNLMGSYASQLTPLQRWQIVYYIKRKQAGEEDAGAGTTASGSSGTASVGTGMAAADTTAK